MTKLLNPVFWCLMATFCFVPMVSAQTTEFTYQGSLKDGANLANGPYDFEFALYDGGGSQLGATLTRNGVVLRTVCLAFRWISGTSSRVADGCLRFASGRAELAALRRSRHASR